MGLLDKIKADAQKSGQNKNKFIFFRDGDKKRVRFLSDMEEGLEIIFHDSFEANINVPCQESTFGRHCIYCGEDGVRTRSQYAWSVWDCENNEVKILMYPMNNCSPVGAIAALYETYGTLLDRDIVIGCTGKQQNKQFSVIPMDKNKFRNEKAKPFSKSALLKILDKAYPDEHSDKYGNDDNDDEEEYEEPKKNSKVNDSEEDWDNENDYSDMSAKELYKLCKERDIEVLPKKPEKYYINLLKENDKAHDDWEEDDEDEEDWD